MLMKTPHKLNNNKLNRTKLLKLQKLLNQLKRQSKHLQQLQRNK